MLSLQDMPFGVTYGALRVALHTFLCYTVFAYSRDSTGAFPVGDTVILKTVEILGKRDTVNLGTLTVLDN